MLSIALLLPLLGAGLLVFFTAFSERSARLWALAIALAPLIILIAVWSGFDTAAGAPRFQFVENLPWIPTLGVGYRLGVDGIALALAAMTCLLFPAAIAYPVDTLGRPRQYYAWLLFLETVTLGVFLSLDLLLFYVFFDLSLVGMYFLIGRWGHGDCRRAALKFFIYTLVGSLVLLLGILGLYLNTDPLSFDMRILLEAQPLSGNDFAAGLVFLALFVGFAIKTPLFPFHTWLPPAHVNAPAPASAILAGVLLKLGTYGLLRISLGMMQETFQRYALAVASLALVSIIYGALVAMAQSDLKRRIAYTSVNHMGYAVLGIAAGAVLLGDNAAARSLALTGATVEMVAHGLITGSLFLISGSFWRRRQDYEISSYGGLAAQRPRLTALTVLAAFASFGLPGLAGFVAEIQIFAGTFAVYPWLAALALLGVVITAALFLDLIQRIFFGETRSTPQQFPDLNGAETLALSCLLIFVVIIGLYPRWLLDIISVSANFLAGA